MISNPKIRVHSVSPCKIKDGPYRNTWKFDNAERPREFDTLFTNLSRLTETGTALVIHVAEIDGALLVIDGHTCLDVYRHKSAVNPVEVIIHTGITTLEAARAAYVAFNYLRATDWLRDSIQLQKDLVLLTETVAPFLMDDPQLARDLINRSKERWDEYSTVIFTDDEPNPEQLATGI